MAALFWSELAPPKSLEALDAVLDSSPGVPAFTTFGYADAVTLGERALRLAAALDPLSPVVTEVKLGGRCVFRVAQPGTCSDNDFWVKRKQALAERMSCSSFEYGHHLRKTGLTMADRMLSEDVYAAHGGCVVIGMPNGLVIGSLTISVSPVVKIRTNL